MFESRHTNLLKDFHAKFGLPALDSESARKWTFKLGQQFNYTFPTEGWGTKKSTPTSPQSTDVICTRNPFIGYDVILSQGAPHQSLNEHPDEIHLTGSGQVFIETPEFDYLDQDPVNSIRLGASLFYGLGALKQGKPQLQLQLREYKDHAVDYVRTIIHLNSSNPSNPWSNIGIHAEENGLEDLISRYCDEVSSFGLKWQPVLTGGIDDLETEIKQSNLIKRFANGVRHHMDSIEFIEMMNEYIVNGGSTHMIRHMARVTRQELAGDYILALSSPNYAMGPSSDSDLHDEVRRMHDGLPEANAITPHWDRHVNRPRNLGPYSPSIIICNEPRGPKSSVTNTDNPNDIAGDMKAARDAHYYSYCLHSDSGVWSIFINPDYVIPNERGVWPVFTDHVNGLAILDTVEDIRLTGDNTPIPVPDGNNKLLKGQSLLPGQNLISNNQKYSLNYQIEDRNLVIYKIGVEPVWHSNTAGETPGSLQMQYDGNFVLYSSTEALCHTDTVGRDGMVQLNDDGNLVYYENGVPLWASYDNSPWRKNEE